MGKEEFVIYLKCRQGKETNLNLPESVCSEQTVPQGRDKQELDVSKVQLGCRLRQTAADNHYRSQPGSVLWSRISQAQLNWLQSQVQLAPGTPWDHEQLSSELGYFVLADVSAHALGNPAVWRPKFKVKMFSLRSLGMMNSLQWDLYLRPLSQQMLGKNLCMPLTPQPPSCESWDTAVNSFLEFIEIAGYIATFCKLHDCMAWKQ